MSDEELAARRRVDEAWKQLQALSSRMVGEAAFTDPVLFNEAERDAWVAAQREHDEAYTEYLQVVDRWMTGG